MTMPLSGAISLGDARTELELTGAISLGQTEVRELFEVSAGAISLFDGYGKSAENSTIFVSSTGILAFPWSSTSGFGTRFPNESPSVTGTVENMVMTADQKMIQLLRGTAPYNSPYNWSDAGFGSVATSAAGLVGVTYDAAFTQNDEAILFTTAQNSSDTASAFHWSPAGVGAAYPGQTNDWLIGIAYAVAMSPDKTVAVFCGQNGVASVPWDNTTGFGTGARIAGGNGSNYFGLAFSPDGLAVVFINNSAPVASAYKWVNNALSTGYAAPSNIGTAGRDVAFSPDGTVVAIANTSTANIAVYKWSFETGFGTKYPDPAVGGAGAGKGVAFSKDGKSLALTHASSPFVTVWEWDNVTGFGAKYPDPFPLPSVAGKKVMFI